MKKIILAAAAACLLACTGASADGTQGFCRLMDTAFNAGKQGDADGQSVMGAAFYSGYCAYQDYEEAMKWFRKAAAQGDAEAQYMLGKMYEQGQGVEKSEKDAESWFSMACYGGEPRACGKLFSKVVAAAGPLKQQVELCHFDLGALTGAQPNPDTGATSCSSNTGARAKGNGWNLESVVKDTEGRYIKSAVVIDGVITLTSKNIEMGGKDSFTLIFVPIVKEGEDYPITWTISPDSTCRQAGIC
jgi:hypothetical protein